METILEGSILNVSLLEPKLKHPTIFARFDELGEEETLTILNDHDPKPLYYQMLGERGNVFAWKYVEQGPEQWQVQITKRSGTEKEETLGQLAGRDWRKAQVFKKYGLDFCCGGKKTVKQACQEKGLDVTQVENDLQQADNTPSIQPHRYHDWSLDFLADYIVNTHHEYVRKSLPDIRLYAEKVMKVHGSNHPELTTIHRLVEEVSAELSSHMFKEEKILFPYIKKLVEAMNSSQDYNAAPFGKIQNPINMMEMEHEIVGNNLAEIRALSNNYALPSDSCASYSLLYRMLEEFEDDLQVHIHIENNILFPKALEMEKQLSS
jgi:regulator of cell morphogenesis and NO signaling